MTRGQWSLCIPHAAPLVPGKPGRAATLPFCLFITLRCCSGMSSCIQARLEADAKGVLVGPVVPGGYHKTLTLTYTR